MVEELSRRTSRQKVPDVNQQSAVAAVVTQATTVLATHILVATHSLSTRGVMKDYINFGVVLIAGILLFAILGYFDRRRLRRMDSPKLYREDSDDSDSM